MKNINVLSLIILLIAAVFGCDRGPEVGPVPPDGSSGFEVGITYSGDEAHPTPSVTIALGTAGYATIWLETVTFYRVRTLVEDQWLEAGVNIIDLPAVSEDGERLQGGIYFLHLKAPGVWPESWYKTFICWTPDECEGMIEYDNE